MKSELKRGGSKVIFLKRTVLLKRAVVFSFCEEAVKSNVCPCQNVCKTKNLCRHISRMVLKLKRK